MAGTRKAREREQHRREVLEAAEAVFAEKGFYSATVQEIADRAEFAVGTIYNMFESKTAIYNELVQMRIGEHVELTRETLEALSDPIEKVKTIIRLHLRFVAEHQAFMQIFTRVTSGRQEHLPFALSEESQTLYRDYIKMVSDVFREGIKTKVFIDADPVLMTLLLEGIVHGVMMHALHTGGQQLKSATAENIERVLFDGLMRRGKS